MGDLASPLWLTDQKVGPSAIDIASSNDFILERELQEVRSTRRNNHYHQFMCRALRVQRHVMIPYIGNARLLRDTAAKAVSHRDTVDVLERLDKQIALLEEQLGNALVRHDS
ncbi:hypothetical protein N7478_001234 [Penicillium angulare]|uniref:uncharacterized protein n=1 Tax=Penicillium angulare TaxID=116970 RepID=UPI0025411E6C|nr:uncharacterized protein N7478_001234 [Penicillium angulare]KAJ5291983.1 hypothetical protein N7478_001234 [Penicillium angulare]